MRRLGLDGYLFQDSPQPKVPVIHIAGTKGKGSTAAMVAATLTASGRKTGLYTSPHLHRLEERFRVDGIACSHETFVELVDQVADATLATEAAGDPVSFFELTTAIALMHFDRSACDAIVLEVGLGGRLDSTNVCSPTLCAVTSIGLDHQHVLGNTLEKIATEKAGIIKSSVPVVSGVCEPPASQVIQEKAASAGAPLRQIQRDFDFQHQPLPTWGGQIQYQDLRSSSTSGSLNPNEITTDLVMEGKHQGRNAAIAIALICELRQLGMNIPDQSIESGLGQLQCDGRIERFELPNEVTVIVDTAHNEDSVSALCETLRLRSSDQKTSIVFGTSTDKSADQMLKRLADVGDEFVLTRFHDNPRYQSPEQLQPLVPASLQNNTSVIHQPIEACQHAISRVSPGGTVVVCGSFFLAAETRIWIKTQEIR